MTARSSLINEIRAPEGETIPLIVRLPVRSLEESGEASPRFSFFLVLFLSFGIACGNVENSRGSNRWAGLRIKIPNHVMVKRRLSDPARAGSQTHAQMLSFEDSAIRVAACFWRAIRRNEVGRKGT